MIIKTSQVMMSAEHEKRESSVLTQMIDAKLGGLSFNAEFEQVGMKYQSALTSMNVLDNRQVGSENSNDQSILVMTDEGVKFRQAQEAGGDSLQIQQYKSQLFQLLIDAINSRRKESGAAPISLPSQEVKEVSRPSGSVPMLQDKPLTLEMKFNVREEINEYECSSFSSCGNITTADGREIDFSLSLQMERSYSASREYTLEKQVKLTDPLVLNFAGESASLSDETFSFDLDVNGDRELISYLNSNSAFLALDKNKDGEINDGSELFGSLSGDGFADLAAYDLDGNNYIDEADAIFSDLQLWAPGTDSLLVSLAEKDVGAIYLGSTETPFDLKNSENQEKGRVRSTGVYLTEAGDVGTVQQVDMAV